MHDFNIIDHLIVESKMGAVVLGFRWLLAFLSVCRLSPTCHDSVSHPRSSNRTCGSPASGFPTGFSSRHTLDGRSYRPWQHYPKFSEHSFRRIPTDASRTHLMPFNQKTSDAVVNVPLHRPIRNHRRAIAKVRAPTPQKRIQPVSYIRSCSLLTGS